jgi:hypothetical protein
MRFGIGQQSAPRLGQVSFPAPQFEEIDAQLGLQTRHCVTDRGLRSMELSSSRREAAQFNNSMQNFPFIKGRFHHH